MRGSDTILYFIILILYLFLLALAAGKGKTAEEKKCRPGLDRWFYRMAAMLYRTFPQKGYGNARTGRSLMQLNPGEKEGYLKRQYDINKLKGFLIIIFAGDMAALLLWIAGSSEGLLVDNAYLLRQKQGEGDRTVRLLAKNERGEEAEAAIVIRECRYEEEELEFLYEEMLAKLAVEALAQNSSWECIVKDLYFMESLEDYPFTLEWSSDNYALISESGKLALNREQKALVSIRLKAEYYDFSREHVFCAKVFPPEEVLSFTGQAQALLKKAEEAEPYKERILLPPEIGGSSVIWSEKTEKVENSIFVLCLLGAGAFLLIQDRELQNKARKRKLLMAEEYPALISKLTLYLGAGMNLKSAWVKIAQEGCEKKNLKRGADSPIYQEMLYTCREMEGGIPEAEAYERFGKRIQGQRYIRLTTLLVQNLKKGNAALLLQMRQEAFLALEERAASAKKKGEEIGTKLLLPMMLMMGMVMVLIIIPAFLAF